MRFACAIAVLLLSACDSGDPPAIDASAPSVGQPMMPLQPSPVVEPEPEPDAPPPSAMPERRVIARTRMIGWHRFHGVETVDGTWEPPGAETAVGAESVGALGRTFEGCVVEEDNTYCPEVGIVSRRYRQRGWRIEERVVLVRRGDQTWAESPCGVMQLIDDALREGTCGDALRTLGAAPWPGLAPRDGLCRWRYRRAARDAGGDAVVRVRMSENDPALEAWAGADDGAGLVEHPRHRTWVARRDGWTAAVRVDRRACPDGQGAALAERLVELAPR